MKPAWRFISTTWGVAYKNLKDYESAFKYLKLALSFAEKTNYQSQTGVVLRSFGQTHLLKGEYDEALNYVERAIRLQRTLSSKVELMRSINLSGDIYLQKQNYAKAILQAREALNLAREVGMQLEESRALDTLYKSLEKQGKYKEAYAILEQHNVVKDSLFGQEKAREIGRIESRAELDRQAQENERPLIENELNKSEIGREKARTTTFVISTASLALLVFGTLYVLRNKQKTNDEISQKNEALTITTADLSTANDELNQLSNFKEGLTNMIAHDMKNSLNSIIGYASNDLKDHRMAVIHQSGQNILNLVLNMLDVQRFEEAKVQLNKRRHSINELMHEAKEHVQMLASERNINLTITPANLPSIEVDGDLIVRVMINLLTNAIKYSGYDSTVTLSTQVTRKEDKAFLTTTVTDQGEGIAEELLPHLFDKFWQTEGRQSGNTPSTGLGLTFCKLAVESHQGHIYAQSQLGIGTTIAFDLPLPESAVNYLSKKEETENNPLSDHDQEVLARYAGELQKIKIYQVKALKEVIDRLESEIKTEWSKDVLGAAFEGDNDKYQRLIKRVLSES